MLDEIAVDEYNSNVRELTAFLYILMRDHLPSGVVHGILIDHTSVGETTTEWVYSNPFLAAESMVLAKAILGHSTFKNTLRPEGRVSPEELMAIRASQPMRTEAQAYAQMDEARAASAPLGNDPLDW
jgi:hypothetical protein